MADPLTITGSLIILILAGFCLFLGRRAANLQNLLQDAGNRFKEGRISWQKLLNEKEKQEEQLRQEIHGRRKLEEAHAQLRNHLARQAAELQELQAGQEEEKRRLILRTEHLQEEGEVLKAQLAETTREKEAALREATSSVKADRDRLTRDFRQKEESLNNQGQSLQGRVKELENERRRLDKRVDKLSGILKKVDPGQIRTARVRARRMEQLYNSMKGLREMAEERNENWEVALRSMAGHILGRQPGKDPIGSLVGEALEKIGVTLVSGDQHLISDETLQEQPPSSIREPEAPAGESGS